MCNRICMPYAYTERHLRYIQQQEEAGFFVASLMINGSCVNKAIVNICISHDMFRCLWNIKSWCRTQNLMCKHGHVILNYWDHSSLRLHQGYQKQQGWIQRKCFQWVDIGLGVLRGWQATCPLSRRYRWSHLYLYRIWHLCRYRYLCLSHILLALPFDRTSKTVLEALL